MTESTQAALLRRKTRPQGVEVAENPLTSSRAVRLALTKAANDTVGLVLTVQSVGEEITHLDDMLGTLADDLMLVGLGRGDGLTGLIALDMEMRAAVVEMETMGAVLAQKAEARAPTLTDKTLCDPLLQAFLAAFPLAVQDTPLQGWMDGISLGSKLESTRAAGLILEDCDYRIVRLNVDLGVAERQAQLVIALPLVQTSVDADPLPDAPIDWHKLFHERVSDAPASLDALLHRFPISLATAEGLQVGSVLRLPGCTVNSVRLLSPDGAEVAQAKLGQIGGYRAVRLEAAPVPQLGELSGGAGDSPMSLPDPMDVDLTGADLLADDPPLDVALDVQAELDPIMDEPAAEALLEKDLMSDGMADLGEVSFDPETL